MLQVILAQYNVENADIKPFGNGLINSTWRITQGPREYILQKINNNIFKHPAYIAANIETIAAYLKANEPGYFFVSPLPTIDGKQLVYEENNGYYRLFPFVKNSHTHQVANHPQQAYEAAKQFGRFTKVLKDLPAGVLKTTLPDFHNLMLRYTNFIMACGQGNKDRIKEAANEIAYLKSQAHIVATYEAITKSPGCQLRVTHHDTKISNVLFDENDKGICVIDLDTVMPGYFISDVGDIMRTYLSPVSEEEKDYSKIYIRDEFFEAILQGYMGEMAGELTAEETGYFVYSGLFLIYMQAVRFLTDHLNNDVYYGAAYTGQNLVRTKNQVTLLQRLLEKESDFTEMVRHETAFIKNNL